MFKRKVRSGTLAPPAAAAPTFEAGGNVGALHDRLRTELGLDWDDPIVYEARR